MVKASHYRRAGPAARYWRGGPAEGAGGALVGAVAALLAGAGPAGSTGRRYPQVPGRSSGGGCQLRAARCCSRRVGGRAGVVASSPHITQRASAWRPGPGSAISRPPHRGQRGAMRVGAGSGVISVPCLPLLVPRSRWRGTRRSRRASLGAPRVSSYRPWLAGYGAAPVGGGRSCSAVGYPWFLRLIPHVGSSAMAIVLLLADR
jgi:hypothetical protein